MKKFVKISLTLLNRAMCRHYHNATDQKSLGLDFADQKASDAIKMAIEANEPCMVCRFGGHELKATIRRFEMVEDPRIFSRYIRYLKGQIGSPWWDDYLRQKMTNNAGFFPGTDNMLDKFGDRMLEDIQEITILGSWLANEYKLRHFFPKAKIINLQALEPYYHKDPWSKALAGRTVLVVHPFEETIQKQYNKRHLLFKNGDVLPIFRLKTLKAVQSIGNNKTAFNDWFEALEWMCSHIEKEDFDIAIIGAGAYGIPLAAHIKRIGKKAIHMGGATQILFGIKGKRWDNHQYISTLYNEHWIRASVKEQPTNFQSVETGCYW